MFSCETMTPTVSYLDSESIVDDEILSLKSIETGEEDSQEAIFASGKANFGQRVRNRLLNRDCITVTTSGDEYPKEIVLDYGEGCMNKHGELKTGKVIITLSDMMMNEGAEHVITYENVMVGDKAVELTKTKKNVGQNTDGNWEIESTLLMVTTYEDESTSTRNISGKTEWLDGFGTESKLDDIFLRYGNGSVLTSEGAEYTRDITTPLLHDRSCLYIKSGVVELNKDGQEITIDFGEGECDRWATVTTDGESKEIDLSERKGKMRGFRKGNGNGNENGGGNGNGNGGGK